MLAAAILAGGLATRLRPITETIPKALVKVSGKPFIYHQLDYLCHQGIERIVLCVGYRGEMIQATVGDGSGFGVDISYSFDGQTLLGTGGALKRALPLLGEQFFVLYGDSFLPIEFEPVADAFHKTNKFALMTVLKNKGRWDKSNVLFRDGKVESYNKYAPRIEMDYIDYGLAVLSSEVLDPFTSIAAFDLADLYSMLSIKGELAGYEVFERFYEIGSHRGLKETEDFFMEMGGL